MAFLRRKKIMFLDSVKFDFSLRCTTRLISKRVKKPKEHLTEERERERERESDNE